MPNLFAGQMDFVFFVYGLAFFLLGAACLTLRAEAFPRLPWGWLAAFAFSHGAAEWLDLAVLTLGPGPALVAVKTAVMVSSFLFLLEFARRGLGRSGARGGLAWGVLSLVLFALVVVAGVRGGMPWVDVAARYLLALPAGLLAGVAIYRRIPSSRAGTRPWLVALAAVMMAYAVLAGAITPAADLLPARWPNQQNFLALTGIPIQVPRALAAVAMAIAMWVGSQVPGVRARNEEVPFHYALGLTAAMLVIVPGGWGFTDALADHALDDVAAGAGDQAHALARIVDQEMARASQAAQLLAGDDAVRELARNPGGLELEKANEVLDQVAIAFRLEAAYLLDTSGTVVASSNRNAPESFVAKNYAFRPYFRTAMDGRTGSQVALGVTSRRLGHYASMPVRGAHGQVGLVVALKSSLPPLAGIARQRGDLMLLTPRGVVLDATDPDSHLHSLWPLSEQEARALIDSRQLGPGPFPPLLPARPVEGQVVAWRGRDALFVSAPLALDGWSMAVLAPLAEARAHRLFGIGATLVLSLLAIGFYILLYGHESYELRLGALMAQLRDQAHTDPLTRLANRGWFEENFERELAKAERLNRPLALVMFDVDHFKAVNDRFGHQTGDRVLIALSARASQTLRNYDLLGRWGGEEFVALLPETDLAHATGIAERLREEIAALDLPGIGQVSCSFGVAERRDGEDPDGLLNRADAALYQAKDAGRNQVQSV